MRLVLLLSMGLLGGAWGAGAQRAPETVREITLDEAIHLALRHNLDIQIQRYNPRIARLTLDASFAAWEPTFDASYTHNFSSRPSGPVFIPPDIIIPAASSRTDSDLFSAGIRTLTPSGLLVDLGSDISRREQAGSDQELDYTGFAGITLRQPLLRNFAIDQTRYQILFNRRGVEVADSLFQFQVMNTILQVHQAYYNLAFARENVNVRRHALDLAERLVADNRIRGEAGAIAPLEEKQSESQARARKAEWITAQAQMDQQENVLKRLISSNIEQWLRVQLVPAERLQAVPAMVSLEESLLRAMASRPDLRQFRLEIERREITLKYQRNQLLPSIDATGSFGYNALESSFNRTLRDFKRREDASWGYGVVMSIPLGNRAATSQYRINRDQRFQAELQYRQLEQDVQIQVDDAINAIRSSLDRVEATREASEYARTALDAEQTKLEHGKSTSFVVLELQNQLTAARLEELRALVDYNIAIANLAYAEGTLLEKNNIVIDVEGGRE